MILIPYLKIPTCLDLLLQVGLNSHLILSLKGKPRLATLVLRQNCEQVYHVP
ncbi:hypothetical protein PPEP_a3486 [Pseudoalteromonas peptidolytica F12-50-A1]|uniref:Uncharacterized protein n=1 Tax=Pseudoalteromonas peptidolytica F12-50-A1 TaxID=1315280 RepID=A0A8I0MTS3_9GAMM|nr:hypothetical protein [Pseudoalteromonas peptidolytica F12-50-A1]